MRSVLFPALALACFAALPLSAQSPPSAPARAAALDPARIHADYQAGEFEKVIRVLEAFRESGRRCRKADSVFLEKHLAVVYAADPRTRERGRYHMLRMLDLEPEADLLDMFVGEAVDGIFEKVRRESRVRRMDQAKARAAQAPRVAKAAAPRPALPEPGPAPRLKTWNLEDAPAPERARRRPGVSRSAAIRPAEAAREVADPQAAEVPPAPGHPQAAGNPRRVAAAASALPAWHLDRTASSTAVAAPAMGLPPPDGSANPVRRITASQAGPGSPALPSRRPRPVETSAAGSAEDREAPAEAARPEPKWKEKRFWAGGTAVAAVLGLTAFYVVSQEWGGTAAKNRTYGVAAKPNAD